VSVILTSSRCFIKHKAVSHRTVERRNGDLVSFDFTPQRNPHHLVPRIGLVIGEGENAVFNWLGLKVPGGKTVGFGASKEARAASYRNDTGGPTQHIWPSTTVPRSTGR
jgi:hypothetical protein